MNKPKKTMKQHRAARAQWNKDNQELIVSLCPLCMDEPGGIAARILGDKWCPSEKQVALLERLLADYLEAKANPDPSQHLPTSVGERVTLEVVVVRRKEHKEERHPGYFQGTARVFDGAWVLLEFAVTDNVGGTYSVVTFASPGTKPKKAACAPADLVEGDKALIRATVAEHGECKRKKQTKVKAVFVEKLLRA